jgi:hypothetical protein
LVDRKSYARISTISELAELVGALPSPLSAGTRGARLASFQRKLSIKYPTEQTRIICVTSASKTFESRPHTVAMPLTTDLNLLAEKLDPKNISQKTHDFNQNLMNIMKGNPKWYEVGTQSCPIAFYEQ